MSRMASCPSCGKEVAVTQYGKCVLCGKEIALPAPPTVPRRNGAAVLGIAFGALLILVGVGAAVRSGDGRQVVIAFVGAGICAAGWRFLHAPPL